jgi:hypothetical protein
MESTGVYWILVYEILEQRGFEVMLVNARYAKNVPGGGRQMSAMPHGYANFIPTACYAAASDRMPRLQHCAPIYASVSGARRHQINRLPLLHKRSPLHLHSTPPGSPSLLQVSTSLGAVHWSF